MRKRRLINKVFAGVLAVGLMLSNLSTVTQAAPVEGTGRAQTVSAQMPFRDMTAEEMVAEMGTGWNLGNTMDGHTGFTPGETIWQNVETTQALMKAVHDAGFNTVRVPVTWGTMIDDSNGYQIDDKWMSRVQDIVDYAINMNMYVIINIHHDGAEQTGWFRIGAEDLEPVREKYEAVWRQIAERFKDYDEHLIFESMNEVVGPDNSAEGIAKDTQIIMEFNQLFVDTVRATGSNNEYRWLSVPGRYTNITNMTSEAAGFDIPKDSTPNRLFVAVHHYDWTFGLLENAQGNTWNLASFNNLIDMFDALEKKFTSKGIPVILGEYGAINKNNDVDRAYHMEGMNRLCQLNGVVPVYWDQGWYDLTMTPDFSFTLIDRATLEEVYPTVIEGIMRGIYFEGKEDLTDIVKDTTVTPITDMGTYEGVVTTTVGEVVDISLADYVDKSASNDVVLWKSLDETIATVNADISDLSVWAANLHGTGIGYTTIVAYSHNGQAVLEIPVEVRPQAAQKACTDILVEQEAYEVIVDQYFYLNASIEPADNDAFLTYRSSNPNVATVSKIGKVVAKAAGTTYIIMTSSDGFTKVVPVTVSEAEASAEIALALNVYYNDSNLSYFSNEVGVPITVSGDGQYTVVFDCANDLSDNATSAGVTGLNNLTAIYIKDYSVTQGLAKKTPLTSCDIIYDEIKVDGQTFAINMDAPKAAQKASGIFDTNDPINSWDGSVIEEVTVTDHVLNFTEVENPQKVEVTFTLSNMVFEEGAAGIEPTVATDIQTTTSLTEMAVGEMAVVSVEVASAPDSSVAFVSSNPGVIAVDYHGMATDGAGHMSVCVYALEEGQATITAYTENGLSVEMGVVAKVAEEAAPAPEATEAPVADDSTTPADDKTTTGDDTTYVGAPAEKKNSTLTTVLTVIGIAVLGVAVFFITMKVAGGSGKKEEAETAEGKKEEK
ncbi:MAG: cellulase family glycosylhydrolase [Lachnospiraceae bacterium]|nr:cellulase family glycosylhydrolase [Lachnospiraceae bacterium]